MRISYWSSDVCSSDLTFIVLASDGTPKVSHRYFSTAAPKREKRAATVTEDGAEPAAIANVFPRSSAEQLSKERRDVLALHVAQAPGLAPDITIFRMARKFTGPGIGSAHV